jgi:glycosyltransferase involved in cell wall biosynthesis
VREPRCVFFALAAGHSRKRTGRFAMIPLIVDLETEWRGGQSQILLLLRGLYERGHAAELIAVRGSPLAKRARTANIYVHSVPKSAARLRAAIKIRSALADGRIEVVHVNEPHALTAAWLAGAGRRVPLVNSRRVAYPLGKSWLSRARYLSAARILAVSQFVKKSIVESGIPAERIAVIYEGVKVHNAPSAAQRSQARKRWGIGEQEMLFGCVGYLLPEKGQEFAVRAMVEVRAKFPRARLLLAGQGPCRSQLESLARDLGAADAVIFAGFVEEIAQVYRALDAFVFPSLAEPLGTSLLAAMGWGLPVVGVASGGVPEYVEDGVSGLLVERAEHELIAAAMVRVLGETGLAARLGLGARARIASRLTVDHMVDQTVEVYRELVA